MSLLTGVALLLAASTASAQVPMNHHPDADCDGLVYAQEHVLHTSPNSNDSDQDGFSDLEEIARHSSPRFAALMPDTSKRIGVGLTAHAQTDGVHVLVAVFMSDMHLRAKHLKIGILAHGQLYTFPTSYIAAHSTLTWHPASVGAGCVALIDLTIEPSLVHSLGHVTFWAKAGLAGAPGATSAASLHLLSIAGIVVYAMPIPRGIDLEQDGATTGGSIYVPLLPSPSGSGTGGNGSGSGSGGVPASWEPNEVCFQRTSLVGADGAAVTNEVVEADCVGGWDGFCPPNCSSTVGSTFRTVDPLGLIGG